MLKNDFIAQITLERMLLFLENYQGVLEFFSLGTALYNDPEVISTPDGYSSDEHFLDEMGVFSLYRDFGEYNGVGSSESISSGITKTSRTFWAGSVFQTLEKLSCFKQERITALFQEDSIGYDERKKIIIDEIEGKLYILSLWKEIK